ncbi:hypothetical protein [Rubrivirga sp. IMCC45206]|uniref:hypothetical protein n=1 Tax=Rubrivirga sp. IMCC45206 TaxID=3391614 RepID=UPI00398FCDC9
MPIVTAIIALLVSVASFVFAVLVFVDNRRLEREKHRTAALSSTHTATLLLDEAVELVRRVDAFLEASGLALDDDDAKAYDDYRRRVIADHTATAKAMTDVAYGNLAVIECRELAARSTLVVHRTVAGRRGLLDLLSGLRQDLGPGGDGVAADVPRRSL